MENSNFLGLTLEKIVVVTNLLIEKHKSYVPKTFTTSTIMFSCGELNYLVDDEVKQLLFSIHVLNEYDTITKSTRPIEINNKCHVLLRIYQIKMQIDEALEALAIIFIFIA